MPPLTHVVRCSRLHQHYLAWCESPDICVRAFMCTLQAVISPAKDATVGRPVRPPGATPPTPVGNTADGCGSVRTLQPSPAAQPLAPSEGGSTAAHQSGIAHCLQPSTQPTAATTEPVDSRPGSTAMLHASAAAAHLPGNHPAAEGTPQPDAVLEAADHAAAEGRLHSGCAASSRALPPVDAEQGLDAAGGLAMSPRALRLHSEAVRRRRSRC